MSNFIIIETPLGSMRISATGQGIYETEFVKKTTQTNSTNELLERARTQLEEYFSGKRTEFDLPLAPNGTEYQKKVWKELTKIPYGVTTSYGDIAKKIGSVPRAVGLANGSNPIAIIVPCHRVIGANGSMTGYGGGVDKKMWLLKHEAGLLL